MVVTAQIRRPGTRNAVNGELIRALTWLLDWLENHPDVRVFLLTGGEGAFISGGDLREFHQIRDHASAMEMGRAMTQVLSRIEQLECWTVAAVDGIAYGGGWEVMLAFDIRIASERATFGFTQGTFYLPPGWGGLARLVRTVGRDQALRLLGVRAIVDVEEALRLGLVQQVHTLDEFVEARDRLVQELCLNDRAFISFLKEWAGGRVTEGGEGPGGDGAGGEGRVASASSNGDSGQKQEDALLDAFARFWVDPEHLRRVETFLDRKREG